MYRMIHKPKRVGGWPKRLEKVFNKFIRIRDGNIPCISCSRNMVMHAGHFFPVSVTYAQLRFDEKNVNGQCVQCNSFLEGNKESYRRGLIKKYGEGVIQELEVRRALSGKIKWTAFEYQHLIKFYKNRIQELERKM